MSFRVTLAAVLREQTRPPVIGVPQVPRLTLNMLGTMTVALDDGEPIEFAYAKVRALLAYLVLEHAGPHSRERLAGLLWPEQPEADARHSLSQALWTLRRSIADHRAQPA